MHKEESGNLQDFPREAETKLLLVLLKSSLIARLGLEHCNHSANICTLEDHVKALFAYVPPYIS